MVRRQTRGRSFKDTIKEINAFRHKYKLKKRITAGRVRKYLRVIHQTEKKYGPKYLATDHTHKAKGFSAKEINAIAPVTEWSGYVRAGRIGLRLTSRGKRAIARRK